MKPAVDDKFLGAWTVRESVFAADGSYAGSVAQLRHLHKESGSEDLIITQWCEPDAALRQHPMARFAGEFIFRLQKQGRLRRYCGPDVQGFGLNFGERFLMGQGIWPRFGFNFRSWSIAISPHEQLTGGCFFRGAEIVAVIMGVGRLQDSTREPETTHARWSPHDLSGTKYRWDPAKDHEEMISCHRQKIDALHWQESEETGRSIFQLQSQGQDYLLSQDAETCGMAKAYGPLLLWETFDRQGESTQGLEINDPLYGHQYSLRQSFACGRLSRLEAVHWQN